MVQPLWRTVSRFLKKLKIEFPYDPEIPFLGIYLDKTVIKKERVKMVVWEDVELAWGACRLLVENSDPLGDGRNPRVNW